jgi:hypothetical protein
MSAQSKPESLNTVKPKVIYVMGAGRSGSTIFGVALGNCEGIFDAGELEAWLRRSGVPNFGGTERLRFWETVSEDISDAAELFGEEAWLCLEHSSSLLRIDRWLKRRRLRQRYREITEDLYRAIAKSSGEANIVDTSHYPLRVRELQSLNGIELYLIYLVRTPQNVVDSFNRRDVDQRPKSPFATNIYLWVTHLLSVLVFLHHRSDRRLFVRYEDFIASPEGVLRDILRRIDAPEAVPDLTALKTGVPFQGNRLLRSEVLSLRNDRESHAKRRRITTFLQAPWVAVHSALHPAATSSPSRERATLSADR